MKKSSLSRLRYEQTVDLCLALGIMQWVGSPLKKLGSIRNDLAHGIDYTISREVISKLRGTYPSERLAAIEELHKSTWHISEEICGKHVKDLEPRLQFIVYVIGLYRDLTWFVEAVHLAKERGR